MKTAIIIACAFLLAPLAHGQHTNWFVMGGLPMPFDVQTPDGSRLNYPQGAIPFRFGLYIGPTNVTERDLELVCLFTNEPLSLFLMWRLPPRPISFATTNYPSGTNVSVQVRGWSMELGNSYEEALLADMAGTGFFGQTTLAVMKLVEPPGAPPVLFGRFPGRLGFFVLKPRRQ